jgi:hypothetical protein
MIDYRGHYIFGPFVANYKLDDEFCSELLDRAKKLKKGSANKQLAGIIKDQRNFTLEDKDYFVQKFEPIFQDYMKRHSLFAGFEYDLNRDPSTFTLLDLWVNFMKESEFNPEHTHSGQLSWVIFLKVPDLTKEYENFEGTGTGPGVLTLSYGESLDWVKHCLKYKPEKNFMWIFPSGLRHSVHPFYTKGERISLSGNLYFNRPGTASLSTPPQFNV